MVELRASWVFFLASGFIEVTPQITDWGNSEVSILYLMYSKFTILDPFFIGRFLGETLMTCIWVVPSVRLYNPGVTVMHF